MIRRDDWFTRWMALPGNLRGAVWQVASNLAFALMAVAVKTLGESLESFEIVFFRCFFGLIITLPFLFRRGAEGFRTKRPGLHLARAAVGIGAMFCGFYALTHIPLAEATTIFFTKTLFTIILAVLVLGEAVHWRRWTATAAGFAGVIVILHPDAGGFDPGAWAALLSALLVAVVIMLIRLLAQTERTATILFYYGMLATLISAAPAYLVWRTPDAGELALLAGMAVLGVSGQACNIRSYAVGEITAMAPFGYLRLLFAAFLAFVLFGEVPDSWTWAGAGIIVASTLYIALREARIKPAAPAYDAKRFES